MGLPVELLQEAEDFKYSNGTIYPDNEIAVGIFADMLTQWRVGPNGAIGMDYAALPAVLSIRRVKDREDVFNCLQTMERAALKSIQGKS